MHNKRYRRENDNSFGRRWTGQGGKSITYDYILKNPLVVSGGERSFIYLSIRHARGAYTSRRIIQHKCSRELRIIGGRRPFSLINRKEEEKGSLIGEAAACYFWEKKLLFSVEYHIIYIGLISCCALP